ncbi:hypothetical protein CEXT_667241 [Caerostris extrusa]|uniref:Uncharacterized protein n=1 Tax=Caerostris extrusa TaxID=172846 RepID=A0AAV4X8J7_CAEEX|nr:hypothetical protein CEXT_667241 [Caerostris extrusa]
MRLIGIFSCREDRDRAKDAGVRPEEAVCRQYGLENLSLLVSDPLRSPRMTRATPLCRSPPGAGRRVECLAAESTCGQVELQVQ